MAPLNVITIQMDYFAGCVANGLLFLLALAADY